MLSFRSVVRVVNERRNWLVILIAGSVVFLGSELFEAIGLDSAVWTVALIVMIAIAARPLINASPKV